jgi:hypothetical protein
MTPTQPSVLPAHVAAQWRRWQSTPVAVHLLSADARAQGYTVVQVPPRSRGLFLDLLPLLIAYDRVAQFEDRRADAANLWRLWHTWTRRLTAYLTRLAQSKDATFPPFPEVFAPWHD